MPPPRNCARCKGRLSTYNMGDYCNPCWNSMSITWRKKHGKKDAYSPEQELRREVREREAIYNDDGPASGDPAAGID